MTINEKTRLLANGNQKPYVVQIPQEDVNNNTAIEEDFDSNALTKAELDKYINDPNWIQYRRICAMLYWFLWLVALFYGIFLVMEASNSGLCEVTFENNGSAMLYNGSSTVPPATAFGTVPGADSSGVVLRMLNQPVK